MCFKIYASMMVHLNYTIYEVVANLLNSSLVFNPHSLEKKLKVCCILCHYTFFMTYLFFVRLSTRSWYFSSIFQIGKARRTIPYNISSKYRKTAKHMFMFGTAVISPTEENAGGVLHRVTRNKHADVRRCRLLRKGCLNGILLPS